MVNELVHVPYWWKLHDTLLNCNNQNDDPDTSSLSGKKNELTYWSLGKVKNYYKSMKSENFNTKIYYYM